MVDQRRSRRVFKQVKHSGVLTEPHTSCMHAQMFIHIDMISGM